MFDLSRQEIELPLQIPEQQLQQHLRLLSVSVLLCTCSAMAQSLLSRGSNITQRRAARPKQGSAQPRLPALPLVKQQRKAGRLAPCRFRDATKEEVCGLQHLDSRQGYLIIKNVLQLAEGIVQSW